MYVVKVGDWFLGSDLRSVATTVIAAHFFHDADQADRWCPKEGEVKKVLVFAEEIR